jgi:hypothetical protein
MKVTGGLTVNAGGLWVSGGLTVMGNAYLEYGYTASDRRLKTNISPLKGALSKITKLRGVYYKWSADATSTSVYGSGRQIGLIAQDVENIFPEVIGRVGNGEFLGVQYEKLIPALVEAIRELDSRVTSLEIENVELRSSMEIIQNKLEV